MYYYNDLPSGEVMEKCRETGSEASGAENKEEPL